MKFCPPREVRRVSGAPRLCLALLLTAGVSSSARAHRQSQSPVPSAPAQNPAQTSAPSPAQGSVQESREAGPPQRIPRQQALIVSALDGRIREAISPSQSRPVVAAQLTLRNLQTGQLLHTVTSGEGIFRIVPIPPGHYELRVEAENYAPYVKADVTFNANEVVTLEISLVSTASAEFRSRLPRLPELGPATPSPSLPSMGTYRELRHRLDSDPNYIAELAPDTLPPVGDVFNLVPNRWALQQPDYRRYPQKGEYPYTRSRWYDPFNRNRLKGDTPIWPELLGQQTFLNITASSETFFDGRRVPSPSGVSAAQAGSSDFFGRGEQAFFDQTLRFTFDLFHGDASFKPVDWRIRITPELSLNDLDVRELGIVSPDVRKGTNRFDAHLGFQEAFAEVKLADLSSDYDFISARAGIQQFNADFRGFLFVDEQPAPAHFRRSPLRPHRVQRRLFQFPREKYQQRPKHVSSAASNRW